MIKNEESKVKRMQTVILAGGASRRMGRDKAMLPYGNTTLLQCLIDRYAVLGPVAVSVNRAGKYPFTGAVELADPFPDQGPLNGFAAGFTLPGVEELFLTAVDLPLGEPALALRLAELRGSADGCVLRCGEKGSEPLFAVYGRRCGELAAECLRSGRRSVRELFSRLSIRYAEPQELPEFDLPRILTNVNTPELFQQLRHECTYTSL